MASDQTATRIVRGWCDTTTDARGAASDPGEGSNEVPSWWGFGMSHFAHDERAFLRRNSYVVSSMFSYAGVSLNLKSPLYFRSPKINFHDSEYQRQRVGIEAIEPPTS